MPTPGLNDARRAVRGALNQYKRKQTFLAGLMGNGSGVVSGTRPGYSLVRIGGQPPTEVLNRRVQPIHGLPVLIGYVEGGNRHLEVLDTNQSALSTAGSGGNPSDYTIPAHAQTHEVGGEALVRDIVYSNIRMIKPLLAKATVPASMQVQVFPGHYLYGADKVYFAGDTMSMTSYLPPTGFGRFVTLYIDPTTNELEALSGSPYNLLDPLPDVTAYEPALTLPALALAIVILTANTTEIAEVNLFDLRALFQVQEEDEDEDEPAGQQYRQFVYAVPSGGPFEFVTNDDGAPVFVLMDLE